jgi:hypothetical protein
MNKISKSVDLFNIFRTSGFFSDDFLSGLSSVLSEVFRQDVFSFISSSSSSLDYNKEDLIVFYLKVIRSQKKKIIR